MRIIGGSANYKGIIFESETDVVDARRVNGDIVITKTKKKDRVSKTASVMRKIPFIRGIWVLIEVFLSAPKGFLLTILAIGATLNIIGKNLTSTTVNIASITNYNIIMVVLVIGIIKFSNLSKYHGAEHKVFNAYLKGKELTVENVKKESRISVDCGSNLAVFFILINAIFFLLDMFTLYIPIISWSLAYELFIAEDKMGLLKPFRLLATLFQKFLLTAEPNDSQIEVGIAGIKELLKEDNQEK